MRRLAPDQSAGLKSGATAKLRDVDAAKPRVSVAQGFSLAAGESALRCESVGERFQIRPNRLEARATVSGDDGDNRSNRHANLSRIR